MRESSSLRRPPRPAGRVVDARLHLLDRQILDVDGRPVGTVDDLEIHEDDTKSVIVTDILTGPTLVTRILGGHQPSARRIRIPWHAVTTLDAAVSVSLAGEQIDATWSERWLRDHVLARIPGGRHVPR